MGLWSDCLVFDLAIVGTHVAIDVVAIVALLTSGPLDVSITTVGGFKVVTDETIVSVVGRVLNHAILIATVSILFASIIALFSIIHDSVATPTCRESNPFNFESASILYSIHTPNSQQNNAIPSIFSIN